MLDIEYRLRRLEQANIPVRKTCVILPGEPEPENIGVFDYVLRIMVRPAVRPDALKITRGTPGGGAIVTAILPEDAHARP